MRSVIVCLCLLGAWSCAADIDNGLVGRPEVECAVNTVEMQFRTKQPFRGKIFVKGHYDDPNCRVDYSQAIDSDRPTGGIVLQHGACDMDRQRMLQPQGLQFSAVVIISFHALFITKVDRAFHIKCLYRETTAVVTQQMEVSVLPTTQLAQSFPMPVCTYTIRKDEIDGEILRYARVGEQVVHRWECQTDVYGILVHSCYVEDGQGEKNMLIDHNGCHTDRVLIGDPTYVEALDMAYREANVFKFADRVAVRFKCQIKLCMKENGGCNGITPPICGALSEPAPLARSERLIEPPATASPPAPIATTAGRAATSTTTLVEVADERSSGSNDTTSAEATGPDDDRRLLRARRAVASSSQPQQQEAFNFVPVDGDFASQFIYVLDTTEDPDTQAKPDTSTQQFESVLVRRSHGSIVSDSALANAAAVCLSSLTFGVLLGAVVLVLVAFAAIALMLLCSKWRPALVMAGGGGDDGDWKNVESSSRKSALAQWAADQANSTRAHGSLWSQAS